MSFKAYTVTPLSDGTWRLTRPEPVRFSGRRGLVAQRLSAQFPSGRWSATDEEWLRMVAPTTTEPRWIVFEQSEDDTLRISRLTAINGLALGGRTELLLQFSPLTVCRATPVLIASAPSEARAWSEGLALDGAADRADSSWLWCERALNIGATVLGA